MKFLDHDERPFERDQVMGTLPTKHDLNPSATGISVRRAWIERHGELKRLDCTELGGDRGEDLVIVSTVLVGVAISFVGPDRYSYETRIFGGRHDGEYWEFSTRRDAEEGHRKAVALALE
jgi:hypothetical protein